MRLIQLNWRGGAWRALVLSQLTNANRPPGLNNNKKKMEKTHADTLREDYQTKTKEELINIVLQLKEEVWDLEIRLLDYEDE